MSDLLNSYKKEYSQLLHSICETKKRLKEISDLIDAECGLSTDTIEKLRRKMEDMQADYYFEDDRHDARERAHEDYKDVPAIHILEELEDEFEDDSAFVKAARLELDAHNLLKEEKK